MAVCLSSHLPPFLRNARLRCEAMRTGAGFPAAQVPPGENSIYTLPGSTLSGRYEVSRLKQGTVRLLVRPSRRFRGLPLRAEIAKLRAAPAMDADFFCQECKAFTQTVLDRSTGDTVCTECALVVDHHYVDLSSEWRVFADDTDGDEKVRVGGASNPLLGDEGGLAPTLISKVNGKPTLPSVARAQATDPQRALIQAFGTISAMAGRLHLVSTIEHRAQEIYKNLKDRKSIVGKPQTAVLAACLFVACRLEHAPRTINEIFSVANGAAKKKIGQAINIIEAEMGSSFDTGTARAGDFMRRFCSHLGMTNQTVKAALEAVQNSEELDIRRAPLSVAAAVIYMITQLSDDKKQLRDISLATGVAEGTIKKAYKDLHPHASRLIPTSFAAEDDLKKLASP